MLLSINEKKEYLGFNDFWFIIIGTIILSLITDFLFAGCSFMVYPFLEALLNWSISVAFSLTNWMVMRAMMIMLRKRFPEFKDNIKRIAILLMIIFAVVLLVDRGGSFLLSQIFGESYHHPPSSKLLLPVLLMAIMITAMYEAIYYYSRLKKFVREEEQAKQVVIEAQMEALRNQARPHFLFNSLNTLRDIIENDPKDEAIQFVDKLSDVYRYILESGNVNLTTLSDELEFAQSYVHIQSERFGSSLHIDWDVDVSSLNSMVLPMSLQLLLENSIKHNVISKSKPLRIKVYTKGEELIVENSIQAKSTQLPSTKIGLDSIQKRYALISGKSLKIINDGVDFIVKIPLLQSLPHSK